MEEVKTAEGGTIIKMPIDAEMKQAYIDYSMSVITSRALPDVRDGLKPVHGASLRLAIEFFATQKTRRRYFNNGANSFANPLFAVPCLRTPFLRYASERSYERGYNRG